jgi:hypothetical protein
MVNRRKNKISCEKGPECWDSFNKCWDNYVEKTRGYRVVVVSPITGRKSDVATNHNSLGPAPLHIDCMVTSVHEENGEILSNAKALLQGRAAEDGYQYKVNDYGSLFTVYS